MCHLQYLRINRKYLNVFMATVWLKFLKEFNTKYPIPTTATTPKIIKERTEWYKKIYPNLNDAGRKYQFENLVQKYLKKLWDGKPQALMYPGANENVSILLQIIYEKFIHDSSNSGCTSAAAADASAAAADDDMRNCLPPETYIEVLKLEKKLDWGDIVITIRELTAKLIEVLKKIKQKEGKKKINLEASTLQGAFSYNNRPSKVYIAKDIIKKVAKNIHDTKVLGQSNLCRYTTPVVKDKLKKSSSVAHTVRVEFRERVLSKVEFMVGLEEIRFLLVGKGKTFVLSSTTLKTFKSPTYHQYVAVEF